MTIIIEFLTTHGIEFIILTLSGVLSVKIADTSHKKARKRYKKTYGHVRNHAPSRARRG